MLAAASPVAICGVRTSAPALANPDLINTVPSFKGNDTGGIIAYPLATQIDVRHVAVDHCATYGKVAKFLAVDPQYGGHICFSCRMGPSGASFSPVASQ